MDVAANLERVRAAMAEAAVKSGRGLGDVRLVAASKKQDAEKIGAAFDAGQEVFGESRVQEARAKIPLLSSSIQWHFIGRLQKNKARHALPLFGLFHSIDSVGLATELDRIAAEEGLRPDVLLEVNVAGEGSKIGFSSDDLRMHFESILQLDRITVHGLMTIPPLAPEAEDSRRHFVRLREFRDELEQEFTVKLPQLSMGMSNDFGVAIEEGATIVRVGSAIFGERHP